MRAFIRVGLGAAVFAMLFGAVGSDRSSAQAEPSLKAVQLAQARRQDEDERRTLRKRAKRKEERAQRRKGEQRRRQNAAPRARPQVPRARAPQPRVRPPLQSRRPVDQRQLLERRRNAEQLNRRRREAQQLQERQRRQRDEARRRRLRDEARRRREAERRRGENQGRRLTQPAKPPASRDLRGGGQALEEERRGRRGGPRKPRPPKDPGNKIGKRPPRDGGGVSTGLQRLPPAKDLRSPRWRERDRRRREARRRERERLRRLRRRNERLRRELEIQRRTNAMLIHRSRVRDLRGDWYYVRSRRYWIRDRRYRNRFRDGFSIYVLPPLGVALALGTYYVLSSEASYDTYLDTFLAPPVRPLRRRYTLDEVIYDPEVRAYMRSVNIDTINFAPGSDEISPANIDRLEDIADAMLATLEQRPNERFLIAGHTDATGPAETNLDLSERRALAVQQALVELFGVPGDRLEAVGYGEQYLRVNTLGPDPRNRRVVIRAIGSLLAQE